MEPTLQTKKRVQPPFLKTAPVKGEFDGVPLQSKKRVSTPSPTRVSTEPAMQAKKRIMQDVPKTVPLQSRKCEPPLQSKRRTLGPPTTLTNGFYDDKAGKADEYALLGNQEKFSENVKYKIKENLYTRDMSPPKQIKLQKTVKHKENHEPSPAPAVNTDQFTKPATPLAPRRQKNQPGHNSQDIKESTEVNEPKVSRSPRQSHKEVVRESKAKQDQLHVVTESRNPSKVGNSTPVEQKAKGDKPEVKQMEGNSSETKNLDHDEPVKMSLKDKRIENMNEFAQTNMEKGVADSASEAPAEYALKYKTGISMPRPSIKMSEYQKQFQWKGGLTASPLVRAEQVVYNNNPQLSPSKKSVIPKVTEYQKQYKAYKLVPVSKEEPVYEASKKQNVQLKKSKSMEELSPGEIPTAGSSPVISPNNKRLTRETNEKVPEPVPVVPKTRSRHIHSEYESNFKPPSHYDYLRGSWHGAAQPDLHIQVPLDSPSRPPLTNWFAEVLELRRKAQEYRQRALGTHFSREHMAQLMAKQTELWDTAASSARSTLSALSLESGLSSHKRKNQQQQGMKGKHFKEQSSTDATVASDEGSDNMSEVRDNLQPRKAWSDENKEEDESAGTPSTPTPEPSLVQYHQPSPKSHGKVRMSGTQHRRHHFDRTTPSKDGAILSSEEPKKHTGKKMVARSVDSMSFSSLDEGSAREHRPIVGQKVSSSANGLLASLPTCGMPSRDTHALRDDTVSIDRELRTQFVYTPARITPGELSMIDEGFGQTYHKSQPLVQHNPAVSWTIDGGVPVARTDDDDDVLSVSMQSIASSCSLASATLERARKRKEEFWGKSTVKSK